MAGETIRARAVCLAIHPWSRTSHVVNWLTDAGCVTTLVKGAVRPKSAFLGQYDLNYTCEILYYARAKGDVHALRECTPLDRRDRLRSDYRALALADWFRHLAGELAPTGPEAPAWLRHLESSLDALPGGNAVSELIAYETDTLRLAGLNPEFARENGHFCLRGERSMPVSDETVKCLADPRAEKNPKILLDAARVISVFYSLHLDCAPDVRRTVLRMIL